MVFCHEPHNKYTYQASFGAMLPGKPKSRRGSLYRTPAKSNLQVTDMIRLGLTTMAGPGADTKK
jgi:hypothetical protein